MLLMLHLIPYFLLDESVNRLQTTKRQENFIFCKWRLEKHMERNHKYLTQNHLLSKIAWALSVNKISHITSITLKTKSKVNTN